MNNRTTIEYVTHMEREDLELIVSDLLVCIRSGRLLDAVYGYERDQNWLRPYTPYEYDLAVGGPPRWHSLVPHLEALGIAHRIRYVEHPEGELS